MTQILKHRWSIYLSSLIIAILTLGIIGYAKSGLELLEAVYASAKLLSFTFTVVDNSNNYIVTAKLLSFLFVFSAATKIAFTL